MRNKEVFLQKIADMYNEDPDNLMINIFILHTDLALQYSNLPLNAESPEAFEPIQNRMDEISSEINILKNIELVGDLDFDILINCLKFISNIQKKGE